MVVDDRISLYSIVLTLTPTRETTVRATMGHQAHAAFLRTMREADPMLAEALHAPDLQSRPFTVSPLLGVGRARAGEVRLSPERDYFLRFTVLYPPILALYGPLLAWRWAPCDSPGPGATTHQGDPHHPRQPPLVGLHLVGATGGRGPSGAGDYVGLYLSHRFRLRAEGVGQESDRTARAGPGFR